jgi:hypothetical protein
LTPATRTPAGIVAGRAGAGVVVVVAVVVDVVPVAVVVVVPVVEVVTSAITAPENAPAVASPSTKIPARRRRLTAPPV